MKKPNKKADPVFVIGFIVIAIFLFIGLLTPRAIAGMSSTQTYELGMVKIVSGVLALVGVVILGVASVGKIRKQNTCSACGAKAQSRDDKFCRVCGAAFSK